ncbi:phosphotransferase family protein [Brevirhabdus pacifica]|uniref:Phosphotransferase family protein n=1 Tax=Brevirhabdus pacifica TaxID=1267768 RepID=A0A1U7DLB9_9RHOB|nr:phosphotransferase family protein [Brevirhabdus pacifica]APX90817.1 phosphotransferase family protein [Brevirhabdus pacifica]OWU79595.1 aminoglycoside phosphotransferase [Loktanella sp. 22II-4b]PJJ87295.1 aminoglycoside phosphotransferase (APT) family kinase protein [Brevirhabdus pacifica]
MSDLDLAALKTWLADRMPGNDLGTERIGGGQSNPTWYVDWGRARMVLRKKPAGPILPGAHAIEREFRVLRALEGSEVPVPRALWLEEDAAILGTPFYLMERLEGRVFSDCALPGLAPAERREIYLDMARTLARLHAVRPEAVGLGDFGKPGNYFERQIRRWGRQYRERPGGAVPALDRLLDWLTSHMPEDDGAVSIAHGDFRLGNMIYHPTEPRVIGVLDWELSTLGHPLADLGFCVMPWLTSPDEYGGLMGSGWEGAGVPTRTEFEAEYHAHARPTAPLGAFHMAFALFRFAVIFVGIADRARAGNATSDEAATLAPLAERFAIRGLEVIAKEAGETAKV